MNFEMMKENGILHVKVIGRLDYGNEEEFQNQIIPKLDEVKKVVFDFKKLDYLSSAGIRAILNIRKHFHETKEMVIQNVNEDVYEIFKITGVTEVIDFE